jgi:hypothetical protein
LVGFEELAVMTWIASRLASPVHRVSGSCQTVHHLDHRKVQQQSGLMTAPHGRVYGRCLQLLPVIALAPVQARSFGLRQVYGDRVHPAQKVVNSRVDSPEPVTFKRHSLQVSDLLTFSVANLKSIRAAGPDGAPLYAILGNLSAHKGTKIRAWARKNKVELCFTPTNASWANPVEAHFGPLRQFTLTNSHHPNHTVQIRALHAYLRWRNANARHERELNARLRPECLGQIPLMPHSSILRDRQHRRKT